MSSLRSLDTETGTRPRDAGRRPRTRRPAQGSRASSRFPSRSTWSKRLAICAPAAIPSPDSTMQPSMTPSPSARAACDHAHRLADPARLRELDRDAVPALGASGDVGEREAVLVEVDRNGRAALQLGPVRIAGRKRLLAVFESASAAAARAPPSSDQYSFTSTWSGRSRDRSDGAHALEVEPVTAPELQLQPSEAAARGLPRPAAPSRRDRRARPSTRSAARRGGARAAGGRARRRACPADRGARRRAPRARPARRRERRRDLVERPGVVAELDLLEPGERRLGRLLVARDRRRLAEPRDAVVAELDLDDLRLPLRVAGDHEPLRERQRHDAGAQLHQG